MKRTALFLLVAALAATAPVNARAGTYDVSACAGATGGASSAFRAAFDPGMTAYKVCPNTPSNPATGLVTRASATNGPGRVPYFAGAYQIFESPPGAVVESATFDHAAIRLASNWTTGIVTYGGDFNLGGLPYGCYAGLAGCGIGTPSFFGPVRVELGGYPNFRFETRCVDAAGCDISSSGFSIGTRALFSAANVGVRVYDATQTTIVPQWGALWGGGWHRGYEEGWQYLYDNVGVMMLRLYADGRLISAQDFRDAGWPDNVRCDFTRARPCHDLTPAGVALDTRALDEGAHTITVETVDAAHNVSRLDHAISVDNSAPGPVEASVEGGDQWRRTNDLNVNWGPAEDSGSPVARAHYLLCPLSQEGACVRSASDGAGIRTIAGIKVPRPGEYSVRVWLEDAAGNVNEANASGPVTARIDDAAPEGRFELLDDRDPRRLDVRAADLGSGLAGGSIEIRRSGHRQWHELATTLAGQRLSAHIDDEDLPDGEYEARAVLRDQAGNEHTTERREDGARMSVSLPVRAKSRIALTLAGRAARCGHGARGRRCVRRRQSLVLRGPGIVQGVVTGLAGDPLARAGVTIAEQSRAASLPRRSRDLMTDGAGRFTFQVGSGPSRSVRFRFAGTALLKPASAEVKVQVPARSTIAVSRRHLLNGQAVQFTGRLVAGPLPDGGKLIDLQAFYRRRWRTIATPRSDEQGRWRFRYRFEATSGLVRYRFRARVRREAAYPYELGYSRVVKVTVRGP